MTEKEYERIMWDETPASRRNVLLRGVNMKVPKGEFKFKNEAEKMYYDRAWKEAEEHQKEYGFWPEFEMCEVDWDDPELDIYND